MYKRIMVPMDGSKLAECVLPHVEAFVKGFQPTDLFLVRVEASDPQFEHLSEFPDLQKRVLEYEETKKSTGQKYLEGVAKRIGQAGTVLHTEVLLAAEITEGLILFAEKNAVDLIIIATHGRSGITRWVIGSVADKLIRSASAPVVMVRAPGLDA